VKLLVIDPNVTRESPSMRAWVRAFDGFRDCFDEIEIWAFGSDIPTGNGVTWQRIPARLPTWKLRSFEFEYRVNSMLSKSPPGPDILIQTTGCPVIAADIHLIQFWHRAFLDECRKRPEFLKPRFIERLLSQRTARREAAREAKAAKAKAKADAAAAKMGAGVTVEKVEKIDKDGRIGGRVVYQFKDINTVKYAFGDSMSDAGKDMGPPGAPGDAPDGPGDKPEAPPMTFKYEGGVLTMNNPDAKAKGDAEKPAELEEPDPQSLAMMQGIFKDMKMSLKVEITGGIAETNATHVDGNTITLAEIAFGKLLANPEHLKKLNAMQDSGPAEIAAAFKDVEGLKIETKDTVTAKVK
jgi:hypothetical protein